MTSAGIIGIGAALPPHRITNADLAKVLDTSDEWITRRTGIRSRHILNGTQTLTDLALEASQAALADAGRDGSEVDHIVVSTIQADYITPGLAPSLALELGATRAGATDMNAACAGFVYALDHAAALVETGRAELVLVCGAEALSRVTDTTDRGTAVLFGDGAGTAVVAAGDYANGIHNFVLGCQGEHRDLLYADLNDRVLKMAGSEVYRHAVATMSQATRDTLERSGLTIDDVDLFVAHQANSRIIEACARETGVPLEKVYLNVDRTANTSSASIPLALAQAESEGRLHPGDTVVLAAFGAGFSFGAGVLTWKEEARVPA